MVKVNSGIHSEKDNSSVVIWLPCVIVVTKVRIQTSMNLFVIGKIPVWVIKQQLFVLDIQVTPYLDDAQRLIGC